MAPKKNYKVAIEKAQDRVGITYSRLSKLIDPNGKKLSDDQKSKAEDYFSDLLARLDELHDLRAEAKDAKAA